MKAIAIVFLVGCGAAQHGSITEAQLVARTQALYDAVAGGDQRPWKEAYADDATYADEKGRTMDKAALIADVAPLPKGFEGAIRIVRPIARFGTDVAVLSYDGEEREVVFGQELHAKYHTTDTWLFRGGRWQIVASQSMRYYADPAVGRAGARYEDYAGAYVLGELKATVRVEGGKLLLERGGKADELLPESGEIFFRRGVEGRRLFRRDASGAVDAMIDRRNDQDLVWTKQR